MPSDLEMFEDFLNRAIQLGKDIKEDRFPTLKAQQYKLARDILQKGNGYLLEYDTLRKHTDKGRIVSHQDGADIVIGKLENAFSKSMQLKAVSTKDPKSVDGHIKKALEQLAGMYGEKPRDADRYIAKVVIMNSDNPWPGDLLQPFTALDLQTKSMSRVLNIVRGVVQEKNALSKKLVTAQTTNRYQDFQDMQYQGGHSSRISTPQYTFGNSMNAFSLKVTKEYVPVKEEVVVKVYYPARTFGSDSIRGGVYRIHLKTLDHNAIQPEIYYTHIQG